MRSSRQRDDFKPVTFKRLLSSGKTEPKLVKTLKKKKTTQWALVPGSFKVQRAGQYKSLSFDNSAIMGVVVTNVKQSPWKWKRSWHCSQLQACGEGFFHGRLRLHLLEIQWYTSISSLRLQNYMAFNGLGNIIQHISMNPLKLVDL